MNISRLRPFGRWIAAMGLAAALAACGGGGGGGETPPPPAAQADGRNGDYTLMAVNGREYTLALDFDANTWHLSGNGVDQGGGLTPNGSEFLLQPGNSVGATGTSTTRITLADNTVVGAVALPEGAVPFIAPRAFEDTLAGAVGRYNLLSRVTNADGTVDGNTGIQQGEITADGHLRTCNDIQIFEIANCPAASVTTGTVTVAGTLFTSQSSSGTVRFRVARIGGDKLFVRASATSAGTQRFMIGTPATTSFAPATFTGASTDPAWGNVSIGAGATTASFTLTVTGTSPTGATSTHVANAFSTGTPGTDTRASLLGMTTADIGNLFAIRSTEIGALMAARGNPVVPGFIALGTRR